MRVGNSLFDFNTKEGCTISLSSDKLRRVFSVFIAMPVYRLGVGLFASVHRFFPSGKVSKRKLMIACSNYENNSVIDRNSDHSTNGKLINDQSSLTGRLFKYGHHNASYNACEAIAIHNIRVLKNEPSCLSEVIKAIQLHNGMLRNAEWGSKIGYIGAIMRVEYNIKSKRVTDLSRMNANGKYIMVFWNSANDIWKGIHTVAVDHSDNKYTVYNDDQRNCLALYFDEDSFISRYKGRFITALRFDQH